MGWPTDRRAAGRALAAAAAVVALGGCVGPPPAGERAGSDEVEDVRAESVGRAAEQATVRIRNRACEGLATGSGVVLDDRTLVTNRHVVEGAAELQVSTWDGRTIAVEVAAVATRADLALVRVDGALPPPISQADADPRPGEDVIAVGYPLGSALAFADGQVVDYQDGDLYGEEGPVLRVTTQLQPGSSGGPLVDAGGRLVGVVFAVEVTTDFGLAIPVTSLRALVADEGAFSDLAPC